MYGMFLGVWANPFLGPLIKHPSDTALDICPAAFAAAFPASNRCRENSVGVLRQLVALLDIRDPVIWELNCVEYGIFRALTSSITAIEILMRYQVMSRPHPGI